MISAKLHFFAKMKIVKREEMNENNWEIWETPLCGRDRAGVLRIVENWLDNKQKDKWIATVNPEFVVKTTIDENFLKILKKTDLNVVDGIGLVWARRVIKERGILRRLSVGLTTGLKILGGEFKNELASGSDLVDEFCKMAFERNGSVYFLGGWNDRAERTAQFFQEKYSTKNKKLKTGYSEGEPKFENSKIIEEINKMKPDFLFVAYGMKKQEEWIENNLAKLNIGIVMGVGRSFDYYSGDLKRAPEIWRKAGMEWLYSLIKEPKRFKRQLVLPIFTLKVLTSNQEKC